MRDRNVARLRKHDALAGVAIRRRGVKPRTRPVATETEDIDHQLEIANRGIAGRHGAAADRLDRGDAGIVRRFGDITGADLAWVRRTRRYQIRQQFWHRSKKIDVVAQKPKTVGRDRISDHRSRRGADDDVSQVCGNAGSVEPVREPEQPGNEVLAAAAEHERAVPALSKQGTRGNRRGRANNFGEVGLRVPGPLWAAAPPAMTKAAAVPTSMARR